MPGCIAFLNRRFVVAIVILMASLGLAITSHKSIAGEYCSERWACAGYWEKGDEVQFYLANKRGYPITMTLTVTARQMANERGQKRPKYEITKVLQDSDPMPVLTLKKAGSRPYHNYEFEWTPGDMYAQHNDQYRYLLPFAPDKRYRLVQGFNGGFSHQGPSKYAVDFAMPVGTPVHAARGGVVIDMVERHNQGGSSRRFAKYANFVVILHDDGTTGEYYHLRHRGAVVDIGAQVQAGQLIGFSGNTGFSSLPHLHFAVYRAKSRGKYESLPFEFVDNAPRVRRWN